MGKNRLFMLSLLLNVIGLTHTRWNCLAACVVSWTQAVHSLYEVQTQNELHIG